MAFSSTAKNLLRVLFLTTVLFVILSSNKGVSVEGRGIKLKRHNWTLHLPADIPTALTNFTGSKGNFTDFLVDLFVGFGHQEYTYNGTTWVNSNVSASLYNSNFTQVAHHFFLPPPGEGGGVATWATINDPHSQVTAAPMVKIPQPTAVPLLLLHATFNSGANTSPNDLGAVTHLQRLQTRKGLPPTTPGTLNDTFLSRYSAIYAFYNLH